MPAITAPMDSLQLWIACGSVQLRHGYRPDGAVISNLCSQYGYASLHFRCQSIFRNQSINFKEVKAKTAATVNNRRFPTTAIRRFAPELPVGIPVIRHPPSRRHIVELVT